MGWDELKAAVATADPSALAALIAGGEPLNVAGAEALIIAARYGTADAVATIYTAGGRPQAPHEVWLDSLASKIEPSEKVARLHALGHAVPPTLLANYAERHLGVSGDIDHAAATKAILALGADINGRMEFGWTALMVAVLKADLRWAEQLIAAGADAAHGATQTTHPYVKEHRIGVDKTPLDIAERMLKRGIDEPMWTAIIGLLESASPGLEAKQPTAGMAKPANKLSAKKPATNKPATNKPAAKKLAARPAAKKPVAKTAVAKKAVAKTAATNKPATNKLAARTAAKKPVAKTAATKAAVAKTAVAKTAVAKPLKKVAKKLTKRRAR